MPAERTVVERLIPRRSTLRSDRRPGNRAASASRSPFLIGCQGMERSFNAPPPSAGSCRGVSTGRPGTTTVIVASRCLGIHCMVACTTQTKKSHFAPARPSMIRTSLRCEGGDLRWQRHSGGVRWAWSDTCSSQGRARVYPTPACWSGSSPTGTRRRSPRWWHGTGRWC